MEGQRDAPLGSEVKGASMSEYKDAYGAWRRRLLVVVLFALWGTKLFSQVSGVVVDASTDEPLVGANVAIVGSAIGTVTDGEGKFELRFEGDSATIMVSYLGYVSKRYVVYPGEHIRVALLPQAMRLNEVVVTALGIPKEQKTINYAVQQIKSEDIQSTRQDNVVNALAGQIAGVFVVSSSGTPGASSSILLRGANSVDESIGNQPLFVIDGIPVDNSAAFNGGNRIMDINPDDIESITVLKGPSAAALYGLEAANGVVLITTRSGRKGRSLISYQSSLSYETHGRLPKRQRIYKQGYLGVFDPESYSSWGPPVVIGDTVYDNIAAFFKAGIKQKHALSFSAGNQRSSTYLSANHLRQSGIIPGEYYRRTGVLVKAETDLHHHLRISGSANYVHSFNRRVGIGRMFHVYNWPINDDMSRYLLPNGQKRWFVQRPPERIYINPENPFWQAQNNPALDRVNRLIGYVGLSWSPIKSLSLRTKIGSDFIQQHYKKLVRPESAGSLENYRGKIFERERFVQKNYGQLIVEWHKSWDSQWDVTLLAGSDVRDENARLTSIDARRYRNPELDNVNNLEEVRVAQYLTRRRLVGLFADARLSWMDRVYLNLTGRNDWSSTLPVDNNSFFYPSVSIGIDLAKWIDMPNFLPYAKLRASYAEVGKDAPPHRLTPVLEPAYTIGGGFNYDYYAGNPHLKPEKTRSWEVGTDVRLFRGWTRLDITLYRMQSYDQIIQSRISPASGWIILVFNSGSIRNEGIELLWSQRLWKSKASWWEMDVNIAKNRSKLVQLPSFVSKYPVTYGQLLNQARPSSVLGYPLMAIEGTQYLRNEEGKLVVDEDGYPRIGTYLKDENGNYVYDENGMRVIDNQSVYLGNREPDWIIGMTQRLQWQSIRLSTLLEWRIGGVVLNLTRAFMLSRGTDGSLEQYRNRKVTFDAVVEKPHGVFEPNTKSVVLNQYFFQNRFLAAGENFVEDASWLRLRFVTLEWNVPKHWLRRLPLSSATLSIGGRNFLLWTAYSGGDPETNYYGSGLGGTGTIGLDYFNVPVVKSWECKIKLGL